MGYPSFTCEGISQFVKHCNPMVFEIDLWQCALHSSGPYCKFARLSCPFDSLCIVKQHIHGVEKHTSTALQHLLHSHSSQCNTTQSCETDLPRGAESQAHRILSDWGLSWGVPILSRALLRGLRPQVHGSYGLSLFQNPLQAIPGVQPHPASLAVGPQHIAYLGCNVLHYVSSALSGFGHVTCSSQFTAK